MSKSCQDSVSIVWHCLNFLSTSFCYHPVSNIIWTIKWYQNEWYCQSDIPRDPPNQAYRLNLIRGLSGTGNGVIQKRSSWLERTVPLTSIWICCFPCSLTRWGAAYVAIWGVGADAGRKPANHLHREQGNDRAVGTETQIYRKKQGWEMRVTYSRKIILCWGMLPA